MSFSLDVKKEIMAQLPGSRHCRLAELAALVSMMGEYVDGQLVFNGEDNFAFEMIFCLADMLELEPDSAEGRQALKLKDVSGVCETDRLLVERSCCKLAYIRGAFLAAGSITDPEKGYHFEIVCRNDFQAELLIGLLKDFEIEAKVIERKKYQVVYIKDGEMIVNVMCLMGAYVSLMQMENVMILKDMRNSVNRKVNCETANINKTVNAAVRQIEDIRYIEETKGLKYLPENLRAIARVRMEEPDMPLKELGQMVDPPVGKSGVNHRLRKISEIANELRRNENV